MKITHNDIINDETMISAKKKKIDETMNNFDQNAW